MKHKAATTKFKTIKAALAAGFRERRPQDYGGEEIVVKDHTLVRNAEEAVAMTVWRKRGFRPMKDVEPHARMKFYMYRRGGYLEFDVFRRDQVEPRRRNKPIPPRPIPLAAAVWVINRRAKRARDLASRAYHIQSHEVASLRSQERDGLYRLKSQMLQHTCSTKASRSLRVTISSAVAIGRSS